MSITPSSRPDATTAILFGGVPAANKSILHRIRFSVGDPVAVIEHVDERGAPRRTLILRDIELERARASARADAVACPADYAPASGLSNDRETATAQSAAEFLRRAGVTRVIGDRSLPLIFAHCVEAAGMSVACDPDLGVVDRRAKDAEEIEHLRAAQAMTEEAMALACGLVAGATADADGTLHADGAPLTSERVRTAIDVFLLERGFDNPTCIVAGGPVGADCHDRGHGPLRTGEPVIIDIFPRDRETGYNGDCTRTVVHGDVPDEVARMHHTVVEAKAAATAAVRAGATGDAVHDAARRVILGAGFSMGLPRNGEAPSYCAMVHGTGHGIGLEVHEPPLLDAGGPPLVAGDALTIEPGLYRRDLGGVRVEDLVIVTGDGSINLNRLPEGLSWGGGQ